MNFIFESSSVLKNVCMLLRRITLLLNMACMAGPAEYFLCCKIISDFKNTETLVGDLFMLLLHGSRYCEDSCYIRIQKWQMWPVRQAIRQDSRKDSDHIMDGDCWCRKWRKKWQRLLFTLLHRRDVAHWNSVTQGGNDNFCAFIIKLESEKF